MIIIAYYKQNPCHGTIQSPILKMEKCHIRTLEKTLNTRIMSKPPKYYYYHIISKYKKNFADICLLNLLIEFDEVSVADALLKERVISSLCSPR